VVDLFRNKKWDLIHWRNLWFAISLAVILPGLVAWFIHGFNLGIDFTGGGLITYQLARPLTAGQAEQAERLADTIKREGIEARVQIAGDYSHGNLDQLLVRTRINPKEPEAPALLEQQTKVITRLLQQQFPGTPGHDGVKVTGTELVSPVVSKELIKNAFWSVLIGCIFILAWVRIRYFDFKWAFSAVVALAHDVLVLLGVFAIFHKFEINSPFVAAALTMVGFSVHDTIIIFDRIRENLRLRKGSSFAETANISLLETLARSVNTVLTVVFVLVAVLVFGGGALRDFTFAMLVGVISGAYSSIFNASQLLVVLKQREERALARRRVAQAGRRAAARTRPAQAGETPSSAPKPAPRPAPKPAPEAALSSAAEGLSAPVAGNAASADSEKARTRRKMKASGKRKRRF